MNPQPGFQTPNKPIRKIVPMAPKKKRNPYLKYIGKLIFE
jgi:hypothetical protein